MTETCDLKANVTLDDTEQSFSLNLTSETTTHWLHSW